MYFGEIPDGKGKVIRGVRGPIRPSIGTGHPMNSWPIGNGPPGLPVDERRQKVTGNLFFICNQQITRLLLPYCNCITGFRAHYARKSWLYKYAMLN